METIWCLFSIANQYDQPYNNLECAWLTKPTFDQVRPMLSIEDKLIECLLKSIEVRDSSHTEYRLQEIKLNKIL
jgi:hypothetical protein